MIYSKTAYVQSKIFPQEKIILRGYYLCIREKLYLCLVMGHCLYHGTAVSTWGNNTVTNAIPDTTLVACPALPDSDSHLHCPIICYSDPSHLSTHQ